MSARRLPFPYPNTFPHPGGCAASLAQTMSEGHLQMTALIRGAGERRCAQWRLVDGGPHRRIGSGPL